MGLWNIFANPDFPAPQAKITRLLNADGRLSDNDVLAKSLARFKTSTVRALPYSPPYLHEGRLATIRDVVVFYQRMSDLARAEKMRNPPPEFFAMRLSAEDIDPLVAFLRALNEDCGEMGKLLGGGSPMPAAATTLVVPSR